MITVFGGNNSILEWFEVYQKRLLSIRKGNVEINLETSNTLEYYWNGRSAINAALKQLKIEKNGKVGVQGFTCNVVARAVKKAGLEIVFIDIEKETFSISYENLRLKKDLKCVIIQYTFGITPRDLKKCIEYCQYMRIPVILDRAHCYPDKISLLNDTNKIVYAEIFSCDHTKGLNCVTGGILRKRKDDIVSKKIIWKQRERIEFHISFMINSILYQKNIYMVSKLTIVALHTLKLTIWKSDEKGIIENTERIMNKTWCILLESQLRRALNEKQDRKKWMTKLYEELKKKKGIKMAYSKDGNGIRCGIYFDNKERKIKCIKYLKKHGINVSNWFNESISGCKNPRKEFNYKSEEMQVAEECAEKVLSISSCERFRKSNVKELMVNFLDREKS